MKVILHEYVYIGLTGTQYTPYVEDGVWYILPYIPTTFWNLVLKCNIPDEEATLLRLKYGR